MPITLEESTRSFINTFFLNNIFCIKSTLATFRLLTSFVKFRKKEREFERKNFFGNEFLISRSLILNKFFFFVFPLMKAFIYFLFFSHHNFDQIFKYNLKFKTLNFIINSLSYKNLCWPTVRNRL